MQLLLSAHTFNLSLSEIVMPTKDETSYEAHSPPWPSQPGPRPVALTLPRRASATPPNGDPPSLMPALRQVHLPHTHLGQSSMTTWLVNSWREHILQAVHDSAAEGVALSVQLPPPPPLSAALPSTAATASASASASAEPATSSPIATTVNDDDDDAPTSGLLRLRLSQGSPGGRLLDFLFNEARNLHSISLDLPSQHTLDLPLNLPRSPQVLAPGGPLPLPNALRILLPADADDGAPHHR